MMSLIAADLTGSAKAMAWICFGLGVALVLVGAAKGLATKVAPVAEVKKKIHSAADHLAASQAHLRNLGDAMTPDNPQDSAQASAATTKAQTALQQVDSLVGSLPENLRFAGLLVLIGAVLISVGTVQFGGTSLF